MPVFQSYHSRAYFGINTQRESKQATNVDNFVFRSNPVPKEDSADTVYYSPGPESPLSKIGSVEGDEVVDVSGDTHDSTFVIDNFDWF